jgi:hypothetical protein
MANPADTSSPSMDLQTFNDNFTTTVARFEVFPKENPTCYVVGFTITHKGNLKTMYKDTQVPMADAAGKSDQEIVELGWNVIKTEIVKWCEATITVSPVINTTFVPVSL